MSDHESLEPLAYDIPDACEVLRLSRSFIYEEIKRGRLRAVKCGRRTLIRRQDAEEYLDLLSREQEAAA